MPASETAVATAPADAPALPTHRGEFNAQVLARMTEKVPIELVMDKIHALLIATRPTKHGEAIDTRAVEVGLRMWFAYVIGLPTQRTENVNVNLDAMTGADMVERLVKSPALREQLRSYLVAADERVLKSTTGRVVGAVEQ